MAHLAVGWEGEVIAMSTESYVGWDVEIGDADNDGTVEYITSNSYRKEAAKVEIFEFDDKDLDLSYFEKMMVVADATNDGKVKLFLQLAWATAPQKAPLMFY